MQNMPIAIFRGDDTDALGYQTIVGTIRTDLDLTGCKAVFKYLSFSVEFNPIPADKKLTVIIPASETSKFPPGLGYASLRVYDSEGKLCTFSNRIMVFVATKTPMFGNAEFEVDFNVRPELEPLKIFVGPNPDDFDEYRGFLEKVIDRAGAEKYGLAMLLDAIDSELGADDGVAATPVAVKAAYAAIIKKLTDDYYTKDETDEAIDRVAAYYITYDAAGNPFPTYAALANATTVYSGGKVRTPTRNDYAIVLADETHDNAEYRYIYAVAEGQTTGSWQPQYPVEGVMTVDQTVTRNSQNPVSGGGVWSAIWGALSALPTGFSSLYDWCAYQLAGKASKADVTLTEATGFTDWVVTPPTEDGVRLIPVWVEGGHFWNLCKLGSTSGIAPPDNVPSTENATELSWTGNVKYAATRTALSGYRLGPDDPSNPNRNKPLASAAEAEALRNGKQNALSSQQLANIDAVPGKADETTPIAALPSNLFPVTWTDGTTTWSMDEDGAFFTRNGYDLPYQLNARSLGQAVCMFDRATGKLSGYAAPMTSVKFNGTEGNIGTWPTITKNSNGGTVVRDQWALSAVTRAPNPTTGNLAALTSSGGIVDSLIPSANVALKGEIPYDLGTPIVIDEASPEVVEGETVNYGAATLANRTANVVQVTAATALDELRITFPAATSGKVRDFGIRVEIGTGSAALAAPALVPVAPTGETIKIENADGTIPALADGTATEKGVTLLYFSETASGVFVVKGEQVEEVA